MSDVIPSSGEDAKSLNQIMCDTIGCGNVSKLRCPTCIKLNIKEGSNFCSQVRIFV